MGRPRFLIAGAAGDQEVDGHSVGLFAGGGAVRGQGSAGQGHRRRVPTGWPSGSSVVPDAELVGITLPPFVLGGEWFEALVEVRNNWSTALVIPVTASFNGETSTVSTPSVPPGASSTVSVPFTAPPSPFDCGDAETYPVAASTALAVDVVPENNCATREIAVVKPHWDLAVSVSNVPRTASPNSWISFRIDVQNIGNIPSPAGLGVNILYGVLESPNPGDWFPTTNPNGGLPFDLWTGGLDPGEPEVFYVSFPIGEFAAQGAQYAKAEVNYGNGPGDPCNPGNNNFDHDSVWITP